VEGRYSAHRIERRLDTRIAKINGSITAHTDLSLREQAIAINDFELEVTLRIADLTEEVIAYAIQIRATNQASDPSTI